MNYAQRCPKCGHMNASWVTICIRCATPLPKIGMPPARSKQRGGRFWLVLAAILFPMFGLIGGGIAMLLGDEDLKETGYMMVVAAVIVVLVVIVAAVILLAAIANTLPQ